MMHATSTSIQPFIIRNKCLSAPVHKTRQASSTQLNKTIMKSLTLDQPLLSLEPSNNASTLCTTNNGLIEINERILSARQNELITSKSISSSPKIPDVLLINKYYGLVPQKFVISSRRSKPTTPTASSTKPRAKSSTHQHHQNQQKKANCDGKGYRSENDSPEPTKKVFLSKKALAESQQFTMEEKSSDPFGPVTKKMSVEKYKKWKLGGVGKGRNLNIRSCSDIGQTLSPMDNEFPDGMDSHANRASTEYLTNRRVIKIDLNKVSWDEESYQITTCSVEDTSLENKELKTIPNDTSSTKCRYKDNDNSPAICNSAHFSNDERESLAFENIDNEHNVVPLTTTNQCKISVCTKPSMTTFSKTIDTQNSLLVESTPMHKNTSTQFNEMTRMSTESAICEQGSKVPLSPNQEKVDIVENNSNAKRIASMNRWSKLRSRTISFDDGVNGVGSSSLEKLSPCKSDVAKKRPMTAAPTRTISKQSQTFNTPNSFNPPSQVIPWTQQKVAGGKSLTLAERRAKFQRTSSVHSSSSMSVETGQEDVSEPEVETNCIRLPTNSSAYRETRKALHVTQPPEVPTMISQINPNADEDIQIEIEKVAIMLNKMQNHKHFSKSLDTGIDSEVSSRSKCSSRGTPLSNGLKSTESGLSTDNTRNISENESSMTSVESDSSSDLCSTAKPHFVPLKSLRRASITSCGNQIKPHATSITGEGIVNKTIPAKTGISTYPSNSTNSANKSIHVNTPTVARRPPLRKAVSISCEQELLKTGAQRQNEVNSNANDNGRTSRPKTATGSQHLGTGTRSTHNYNQQRLNNNNNNVSNVSGSGSHGSRNRKILIKKALMEINQSSVNLRRKWGTLGRPRTAPTSDKVHYETVPQQNSDSLPMQQQRRNKPLKASPLPISGNGKTGLGCSSSGKPSTTGGKSHSETVDSEKMEKATSAGQSRASSEAPEGNKSQQQQNEPSKGKSTFRQCFSLDESELLGFSIKSVNEGRIPIFSKCADTDLSDSCSSSIQDDEISFLSSKKREECLKIYEKMMKTGCTIKLDTIFRGMLTPSEYRAFMKAAEKATQDAELAETAQTEAEDQGDTEAHPEANCDSPEV